VVTTCRRDRRIPLVRYNTNDWARVMDFDEVAEVLRSLGREDVTPEYQMPFLALFGRGRGVRVAGRTIYPEQVKEALYAAPELAPAFTANFRMSAAGDTVGLRMQLVPGREADEELRAALTRHTSEQLGLSVQAELVPYHDFTEALDLCYQRKFRYLDWNAGSQT
jgi:phenylacetate-coenzyme A ligase PaaK-like adenylate-forming protein